MDEKKQSQCVVFPQFEQVKGCPTVNELTQLVSLWSKTSLLLYKQTKNQDLCVPPDYPTNSAHLLRTLWLIRKTVLGFSDEYMKLVEEDKSRGLVIAAQHKIESSRDDMDFNHDE